MSFQVINADASYPLWNADKLQGTSIDVNLGLVSAGQVLEFDGSRWTYATPAGSGVTSITGTLNQVFANGTSGIPRTGAITLTLPQDIATTSNVQFGTLGLGTVHNSNATLTSLSTTAYNALLTGTQTLQSSSNQFGLYVNSTLAPAASSSGFVAGIGIDVTYNPAGATTSSSVAGLYIKSNVQGGAGGTITNAYGIYVTSPSVTATFKTALYLDDLSVGYTSGTVPTHGAIISGNVGIGTNTTASSAVLTLASTTQGFRPPVMTNVQKNAIVSPAVGLNLWDSTLQATSQYNGTNWNAQGMVYISSTTFSGVSSVSFTSGIISAYKHYFFIYTNLTSSDSVELQIQISNDGGATYATSNYFGGQTYNVVASTNTWGNANTTSNWTVGAVFSNPANAMNGFSYLFNMQGGAVPAYLGYLWQNGFISLNAGNQSTITNANAIRFMPLSGTITGMIALYAMIGQ